jgi:hypothetical protein
MVELGLVLGVYILSLLIVMRQKHLYMDLLSQLLPLRKTHQKERQTDHQIDMRLQTGRPSDLLSSRTRVPRDVSG